MGGFWEAEETSQGKDNDADSQPGAEEEPGTSVVWIGLRATVRSWLWLLWTSGPRTQGAGRGGCGGEERQYRLNVQAWRASALVVLPTWSRVGSFRILLVLVGRQEGDLMIGGQTAERCDSTEVGGRRLSGLLQWGTKLQ